MSASRICQPHGHAKGIVGNAHQLMTKRNLISVRIQERAHAAKHIEKPCVQLKEPS